MLRCAALLVCRSFAQFRVPDLRSIVAFGGEKNSIVVASADGLFYKALFDPDKPGQECVQDQMHSFTKQHSNAAQQAAAHNSSQPQHSPQHQQQQQDS